MRKRERGAGWKKKEIAEKVFELEKNMDELWENGVETEKLEEENGENKVSKGEINQSIQ